MGVSCATVVDLYTTALMHKFKLGRHKVLQSQVQVALQIVHRSHALVYSNTPHACKKLELSSYFPHLYMDNHYTVSKQAPPLKGIIIIHSKFTDQSFIRVQQILIVSCRLYYYYACLKRASFRIVSMP